jgi:hypothetical protein
MKRIFITQLAQMRSFPVCVCSRLRGRMAISKTINSGAAQPATTTS